MQPIKGFIEVDAGIPQDDKLTQHQLIAVDTIKRVKQLFDCKHLIVEIVIGDKTYELRLNESYESLFMKLVIATGTPILPNY